MKFLPRFHGLWFPLFYLLPTIFYFLQFMSAAQSFYLIDHAPEQNICIYSPFYSWILCYKTRPSSSFILHLECFILLLLFSHSVVSDSLWPHGLQHARLPCPSPSPGACSNLCPLSWWCHTTILSSVIPFSSCLQSFPASGSFLMNWLFASGGQSIGTSASASVLPMNIQVWFPLGLTGLVSLLFKGLSRVFPSLFNSILSCFILLSLHKNLKLFFLFIWSLVHCLYLNVIKHPWGKGLRLPCSMQ